MINSLKIVRAEGFMPYRNQAIEKYLLKTCKSGEAALYLWQNDKTVFIGKNQNAYTECRVAALKEDGGFLARRFTGGGAVYHDKGNLNFTFVLPEEDYDIKNQFSIIICALKSLGLPAELNGRNDMVADGRKFSGNAFYKGKNGCLHHGTVLIKTDGAAMEKYLDVSRVKLEAKGVKSVKSRVCNLSEFDPRVTAADISEAIIKAFTARYPSAGCRAIKESGLPAAEIQRLTAEFADRNYVLGDDRHFGLRFERRYEWGVADVRLNIDGDVIEDARIYSDALDCEAVELKEKLLKGLDITKKPDPRIKDIIETIGEVRK